MYKLIRKILGTNTVFPFYHLAVKNQTPDFIKHLYNPINIEKFKADLDFFTTNFEPINLTQAIQTNILQSKKIKPSFHLTFDDGLANFYHVIAPILKKRNIPATIFLNPAFIDNKDMFYRYKASVLIDIYKKSNNKQKQIFNKFAKEKNVKQFLLNITYTNKEQLNELAKEISFDFNSYLKEKKPYLTTKQIKELQKQGFTFGAHSVDHPKYKQIPLKEQLKQTNDSLNWLEQNLQTKHRVFAFPFYDEGVNHDFFEQINDKVILTFGTFGLKKDSIPFNIQRLDMEKNNTSAKMYLLKQYIKVLLQRPFNKHQIKRV